MAIGRCGNCKYCEARLGYSWCTSLDKEVHPDQVQDCIWFRDVKY